VIKGKAYIPCDAYIPWKVYGRCEGIVSCIFDLRHEVRWGGHLSVPRSTTFTSQDVQEYQGYSGTQFDTPQSTRHGSTEEKPTASWSGFELNFILW